MSWAWVSWIVATIVIGAALEAYALLNNKLTLSRFTWNACKAWPLLPFIAGLIVGGLATHFLWHWCPELTP